MKNIMHKLIIVFMILFLSTVFSFAKEKNDKKILYYRNPMNPGITSPTFMKDSMGMDYIPVYEEAQEEPSQGEGLVRVSQSQQELIGVKTERIISLPLMRMVRTVAKIAYDPELYKAQQEFIQAYKTNEMIKVNQNPEISLRLQAMVIASAMKLKLQGLSDEQIEELKSSKADSDRSLLLSDSLSPYVWAYLTIYEYDLGSVKVGDHVVLTAIAYPGEEFSGKILALDPVLNMDTRSVRARVQIDNPQGKLKPNMYADAIIHIDLGNILAVPREAVLDTGLRKIVYLDLGKGQFRAQEIDIEQEAVAIVNGQEDKFFPVLKGLKENDLVVTTGNFLIDSQSQLSGGMSALWGGATEIKQEEGSEAKAQHRH